jgi:arabinogalactan oligomer/maltooligosaccharide transport system substrate-binding protein
MKLRAITLLTIALVLAAACGGQGGTTTPSATGGAAAGAITGNITLWHAYGTGGSEETAGKTLVQNENAYHMFGWSTAFGGNLMDASGKCVADQAGWADAFTYNLALKQAGAKFETDGGRADTSFRAGTVDMIINGPWVLGDYKKDLGAKLGVAPIPAGPKGKAGPLTGVDGWYINQSAKNVDGAVALALALTNADGQKVYADVAGDVPVRTDVTVSDPLVKAFSDASATGFARPQTVEFGNYWTPFGDAVTKIIEGKSTPQAGIAEACAAMNKANKK